MHPPPHGVLPQALTCHGACLEKGKTRLATSFDSVEKGLETVSHWTWTHTVQLSEQIPKEAGLEEAMTGLQERHTARVKKVLQSHGPSAEEQWVQVQCEAGLCL